MPGFGFPSRMHLRRSGDFSRLKAKGKRVVSGCLIMNWMELPLKESHQLGMIVTKRIGSAVARNRARRLLREVFRLNRHCLKVPVQMVLIARQSIRGKNAWQVETDFLRAVSRSSLRSPSEPSGLDAQANSPRH